MIQFFRKVRYNLVEKNKTGKYLKYAIGEIVLVVIGILIALSINNWNEERQIKIEEISHLLELKTNLEVTLDNFKNDTLFNSKSIEQLRKIEYYVAQDLPYSKDLDAAFAMFGNWQSPYPISTAYTTLKTKGLDIISNKVLRNKIVHIYEYEFVILSRDYDQGEWKIIEVANQFLYKHIKAKNSKQNAGPNDFENLKTENQFSNIVSKIISQREFGINHYRRIMKVIESLIQSISDELNSRT
jgi:hypothetical protein